MANTSMQQASALTSLNGKPLIVLTADTGTRRRSMAIGAGPHGHTVDQQSPPARERHPRFAPRRRSRRCRSQQGNPRRRRRGTHLPAACPALTAAWSWSRSSPPLPGRPHVIPAVAGALADTVGLLVNTPALQPTGARPSRPRQPTRPNAKVERCRSTRHHERACVRAPRVVRMCGRASPRWIRRENHGNGYRSRVWDEDRR